MLCNAKGQTINDHGGARAEIFCVEFFPPGMFMVEIFFSCTSSGQIFFTGT